MSRGPIGTHLAQLGHDARFINGAAQRGHRTSGPTDDGHTASTLSGVSARKARPTPRLATAKLVSGPAPRSLPPGAGGRNSDGGFRTGPHQLAPQWPHESQRTGTRYSTQPTTRELQPTLRLATAMLAAGPRCTASLVGPAAWSNQKPPEAGTPLPKLQVRSWREPQRSRSLNHATRTSPDQPTGLGTRIRQPDRTPRMHRARYSGPGIPRNRSSVKHPSPTTADQTRQHRMHDH